MTGEQGREPGSSEFSRKELDSGTPHTVGATFHFVSRNVRDADRAMPDSLHDPPATERPRGPSPTKRPRSTRPAHTRLNVHGRGVPAPSPPPAFRRRRLQPPTPASGIAADPITTPIFTTPRPNPVSKGRLHRVKADEERWSPSDIEPRKVRRRISLGGEAVGEVSAASKKELKNSDFGRIPGENMGHVEQFLPRLPGNKMMRDLSGESPGLFTQQQPLTILTYAMEDYPICAQSPPVAIPSPGEGFVGNGEIAGNGSSDSLVKLSGPNLRSTLDMMLDSYVGRNCTGKGDELRRVQEYNSTEEYRQNANLDNNGDSDDQKSDFDSGFELSGEKQKLSTRRARRESLVIDSPVVPGTSVGRSVHASRSQEGERATPCDVYSDQAPLTFGSLQPSSTPMPVHIPLIHEIGCSESANLHDTSRTGNAVQHMSHQQERIQLKQVRPANSIGSNSRTAGHHSCLQEEHTPDRYLPAELQPEHSLINEGEAVSVPHNRKPILGPTQSKVHLRSTFLHTDVPLALGSAASCIGLLNAPTISPAPLSRSEIRAKTPAQFLDDSTPFEQISVRCSKDEPSKRNSQSNDSALLLKRGVGDAYSSKGELDIIQDSGRSKQTSFDDREKTIENSSREYLGKEPKCSPEMLHRLNRAVDETVRQSSRGSDPGSISNHESSRDGARAAVLGMPSRVDCHVDERSSSSTDPPPDDDDEEMNVWRRRIGLVRQGLRDESQQSSEDLIPHRVNFGYVAPVLGIVLSEDQSSDSSHEQHIAREQHENSRESRRDVEFGCSDDPKDIDRNSNSSQPRNSAEACSHGHNDELSIRNCSNEKYL